MIGRAVRRRAHLALALRVGRVHRHTGIARVADHQAQVVCCAFETACAAVTELEEGLRVELLGCAFVGGGGESHADGVVGCVDGGCPAWLQFGGGRHREHLEAWGDLEEADGLLHAAAVRDCDLEGRISLLVSVEVLVVRRHGYSDGGGCEERRNAQFS